MNFRSYKTFVWPRTAKESSRSSFRPAATDCAECETREGKIDKIERVITREGKLDDAQRQRLLEIANKCPVHRTLHSEVWIAMQLNS